MTTMISPLLTKHDQKILSTLFDPEMPPPQSIHISATSTYLPHFPNHSFAPIRAKEQAILKPIQTTNPSSAVLNSAVSQLTDLLDENPEYASAYLNRAQAIRLQPKHDAVTETVILKDLSKAINLAAPSAADTPISTHQREVLAAAYTHRGFLLMNQAQMCQDAILSIPSLKGLDRNQIEELANADFVLGARYGNEVARRMSIKTNPYAKMCGAIVKEALREEMVNGGVM